MPNAELVDIYADEVDLILAATPLSTTKFIHSAMAYTQSIELEYEKISLVFDGGKLCGVALNQKRSLSHQLPIRDGKLILKK